MAPCRAHVAPLLLLLALLAATAAVQASDFQTEFAAPARRKLQAAGERADALRRSSKMSPTPQDPPKSCGAAGPNNRSSACVQQAWARPWLVQFSGYPPARLAPLPPPVGLPAHQ